MLRRRDFLFKGYCSHGEQYDDTYNCHFANGNPQDSRYRSLQQDKQGRSNFPLYVMSISSFEIDRPNARVTYRVYNVHQLFLCSCPAHSRRKNSMRRCIISQVVGPCKSWSQSVATLSGRGEQGRFLEVAILASSWPWYCSSHCTSLGIVLALCDCPTIYLRFTFIQLSEPC